MFDYTTLRVIWWLLIGLLFIAFIIMDGFDLGAVILLPWLAKNDEEKRIVINSIGPVWEGNQAWIILGAGAIFAAWPYVYAAAFSGFYLAMLLALCGFILRPVSFKYRSKLSNPIWRNSWDVLLMLSGFIPSLIFGVAMGNVLQGVPFHFDDMLRFFYSGSFWALLNPFALLCGTLSVCMISLHGAVYLISKTRAAVQLRAQAAAKRCACLVIGLFMLGGIWSLFQGSYVLVHPVATMAPSNPLHKIMQLQYHHALDNYLHYPYFSLAPVCGLLGAFMVLILVSKHAYRSAFVASALSIFGIISTVGVRLFPVLLPSSSHPSQSLLIWDASSSQATLQLMLWVGIAFFPIIIAYTTWVYRVMRGPVTTDWLADTKNSY